MLISTSGYTYSKSIEYNEVNVRSGEKLVRLNVRNEVSALQRLLHPFPANAIVARFALSIALAGVISNAFDILAYIAGLLNFSG